MAPAGPEIIGELPGGRRAPPPATAPARPSPPRVALHLALVVVTFLSALVAQVPRRPGETWAEVCAGVVAEPDRLALAWPFALTLMAILVAHEAGHWLVARHHGVAQSLPFFLPAPMFFFGTLGALIVTREPMPSRPVLLRIAAAGPWAGMAVALPAAIWGLANSQPLDAALHSGPAKMFGRSLLFGLLENVFSPNGSEIFLHPVALAAWAGFFITSLNLIPAAQLDGGHIAYALFGDRHSTLGRWVVAGLCGLGLHACGGGGSGQMWLLWALLLVLIGLRHPPVVRPGIGLGRDERRLGLASLALFLATFVPAPVQEVYIEVTGEPPPAPAPAPAPGDRWPPPAARDEEYDL